MGWQVVSKHRYRVSWVIPPYPLHEITEVGRVYAKGLDIVSLKAMLPGYSSQNNCGLDDVSPIWD
jgi:hypothetical protein